MGIFRKQAARAPLTTVLLVLLLTLSIGASSIGFTAWMGARKQSGVIEDEYTTIAVPIGRNFEKKSEEGGYLIEDGDYIYSDGTKYISPESAGKTAAESEYYLGTDNRILLSAHISGSTTLSSGTVDPLRYNYDLDRYCYQLAVIAARCTNVDKTESYQAAGYASYYAEFEIVDRVCQIDAYDLPPYEDTLIIESCLFTHKGKIPFEVGKTYLLRGRYWDYDIYQGTVTSDTGEVKVIRKRDTSGVFKRRSLLLDPEYPLVNTSEHPHWRVDVNQFSDSDLKYYSTPQDCWPYFAECTGSWEDFLNTESGSIWKDQIIPYINKMNHESVPVILTDDLESVYFFNTGDAAIIDGGLFTDTDYENGNAVCIVSMSYAQVNGLSVGDTISLDYYNSGYEQTDYPVLQGSGRSGIAVARYPLSENTRIGVHKEYTIAGIYTAPEWEAGSQSFHADTVFVPKSSVPNAGDYAGKTITLLNTVIIKNGSAAEFESYMASNDKGGAYIYFDQGYSEAVAAVEALKHNAQRMVIVGVAMFALASVLFLLLFARRAEAVMRSMRLLGVPKKQVRRESLEMLIIQTVTAVILGNGLAFLLYGRVTQSLLSSTPVLNPSDILLCGGVQLGVLMVAGILWMNALAGQNLM